MDELIHDLSRNYAHFDWDVECGAKEHINGEKIHRTISKNNSCIIKLCMRNLIKKWVLFYLEGIYKDHIVVE